MSNPWTWYNEAPHWNSRSGVITIRSGPGTDFWRITHYGYTRDNGHFYSLPVRGDFEIRVKISGMYKALYDQAGLMLRVDESNWVKCGVEFIGSRQHASAVVTRDFSDWSVVPLPRAPPSVCLKISRQGDTVAPDGRVFQMIRVAYMVPSGMIHAGLMCASPEGGGFTAVFEDLCILPLPLQDASPVQSMPTSPGRRARDISKTGDSGGSRTHIRQPGDENRKIT